jgi:TATA-box binding protein (TBP) (component of TFIID and TFIIIB)
MLNYIKQELHNKFSTNLLSYPVIMLKNPPPPKPKRKKQKKEVADVEIIYPEGEYTVSAEPAKKITPELIDEITYSEIKPILIDTKFQFKIDPKNIIVVSNLFNILSIDVDSTEDQIVEAQINNETVHITIKPDEIIKPRRGRITTLNRMTEGKIAFFLSIDNIKPNVLFFQSGKVNILGSKAHEVTSIIYDYLHSIMEIYQEFIIVGRQLPDDL